LFARDGRVNRKRDAPHANPHLRPPRVRQCCRALRHDFGRRKSAVARRAAASPRHPFAGQGANVAAAVAAGGHPQLSGVLEATITAAPGAVRLGNHEFSGMLYNGAHIPPTLRVRLGDTLRITFRNNLADRSQVDHPGYVGPVCTGAIPRSNRWNGDSLRDTFSVPPATDQGPGALKAVIPFTDPMIVGRFVYHCHEDKA
jgi:FtsP/CotA-like multicopper oxidase with cupredoxin domain